MKHGRIASNRPPRTRSRPEFHQLAIFLKVAETRSFASTARLIGCTQPAISQSIARLEDIYGGDLFERRRGAPLALTPIGEAILPSARILLHTVDEQMERAVEAAQGHIGIVILGVQSGLAAAVLQNGVADFIATHPDVRLQLVEAEPGALHRQLIEHGIDLVIAASMPALSDIGLIQEALWTEQLQAALPADHTLAEAAELAWSAVASMPLIQSTSSVETTAIHALAAADPLPFRLEQHAVSRETLLEMVGMGVGTSVVLASAVSPRGDVAYRPITGGKASISVDAIWRRHDGNPLRHRLLHHIRQRCGQHRRQAAFSQQPAATDRGRDRD